MPLSLATLIFPVRDLLPSSLPPARPRRRRGFWFALLGALCGVLGIGLAVYRMVGPVSEAPPRSKIREAVAAFSAKVKSAPDTDRPRISPVAPASVQATASASSTPTAPPTKKSLSAMGLLLSLTALAFGGISWLAEEHRRWTLAAVALGFAALAGSHVIFGIAAGLFLVLMI